MATDGPTPKPCDDEIFEKGEPFMFCTGPSNAMERFVVSLRKETKTRIDWHYSGGIAQVLFLGTPKERGKLLDAVYSRLHRKREIQRNRLSLSNVRILQIATPGERGLYRAGVTEVPEGAVAAYYEDGQSKYL